jgi:uncharacterized membrane-anchored protein
LHPIVCPGPPGVKETILLGTVAAAILSAIIGTAAAVAAAPSQDPLLTAPESQQAFATALRDAIGAPARADLGDQAAERLGEGLLLVPRDAAAQVLMLSSGDVPPDFIALLLSEEGMEAPGIIRFVRSGFIDADAALAWSPEDMLDSLNETIEHGNPARVRAGLEEREARRWVEPPRYDPEAHQLSWSALILPKSAPRGSDGEVTLHAIGFGRDGYIELSVAASVQKAEKIGRMADAFLSGLNFVSGKAYGDMQPTDRRASSGLAGAMGLDSLHRAETRTGFWASDIVVPLAGSVVAGIGTLALVLYIHRHMRREARRG